MSGGEALQRLRRLLLEQGGVIGGLIEVRPGASTGSVGPARIGDPAQIKDPAQIGDPAQRACRGPRASAHPAEYELLVEAIYEGYLLHYGVPRLLRPVEPDLALLAGDQLYALGLARLVRLGDIHAVAQLADVISLCALAHGSGEPELAYAVWDAGARAVGWGGTGRHERAKRLARVRAPSALAAMREAAEL